MAVFAVFAGLLLGVACGASPAIHFDEQVRPIFAKHCIACHGGVKQAGGLTLVYPQKVYAGGDSGVPAIVPRKPEESYLLERITDPDPDSRMPPEDHGPPLSHEEIAILQNWIAQGAHWELPWAFVPPQKSALPDVADAQWCRDSLDFFVLDRLETAEIAPAPEASRAEWLRRVSFDLIGLPPTMDECESFASEDSPAAHGRVVDRLLASPHFGERWASMWLDLARYADTTGYERDPHRDIWPYRDWVIRAFNADMPFDEFTIAQLAGDLVQPTTHANLVATAFHRNTQTNTEGGTDDEEYRTAAVLDRVNTTWLVWQATTIGCCQCHAHPYEPISQVDYYRCLAVFNNSRDADIDEEYPLLPVPAQEAQSLECEGALLRQSELEQQQFRITQAGLNEDDSWHNLSCDLAESTGNARLEVVQKEEGDITISEVVLRTAATNRTTYTLEARLPEGIKQITALKIEALLMDEQAAIKIPEMGFVLSQLEATLLPPAADPQSLELSFAFTTEPHPLLDPLGSLNENDEGWGSYSRIWRPQLAVFLLKHPQQVLPGSRIRLRLIQNRSSSGDVALVLNRSRYAVSSHDVWMRLQSDPQWAEVRSELKDLSQQIRRLSPISVPIMSELDPAQRRSTFLFNRGLWLDKGLEVQPGLPGCFAMPQAQRQFDRLDFARWLVSEENPLTARVFVNRVWEQLFDTGIVETVEDMGSSGTLPSHPELLDTLAVRFRDDFQWSVKKLLREIVLSATYRQSAQFAPEQQRLDPSNRLLWRGPRGRLTAEMVRDQALVVSGRFSPQMFGPPVMPPQPEGVWRSVYSDAKWVNATDSNRFRRAIYTYWKRTSGYPSMITFDVPSREVCTARRITTNTPLQALVTLNDETFVECAQGLANQMQTQGGEHPSSVIAWGYRHVAGVVPTAPKLQSLLKLYGACLQQFEASPSEADQLADSPQAAAYVVVASTILNLDEVLTK